MSLFSLTSRFNDCFKYKGHTLKVDLSFDNVLRMFELADDTLFDNYEKIDITLEILIKEYELIAREPFEIKNDLYIYVLKEFLDIDLKATGGDSKKVYDVQKDAGIIYASFLSEYRMDLFEQQGKLHWYKFLQLLTNLSDDTKFKQVLNFRQMKVPSVKESSKEYREHIIKMKRVYSLEDHSQQEESLDNRLDALAHTLRG